MLKLISHCVFNTHLIVSFIHNVYLKLIAQILNDCLC